MSRSLDQHASDRATGAHPPADEKSVTPRDIQRTQRSSELVTLGARDSMRVARGSAPSPQPVREMRGLRPGRPFDRTREEVRREHGRTGENRRKRAVRAVDDRSIMSDVLRGDPAASERKAATLSADGGCPEFYSPSR